MDRFEKRAKFGGRCKGCNGKFNAGDDVVMYADESDQERIEWIIYHPFCDPQE